MAAARLGFQKAGVVAGKTLTFRDGPTEYRMECATPIAPGSGAFNASVLHVPARNNTGEPFIIGGADRAGSLGFKPREPGVPAR